MAVRFNSSTDFYRATLNAGQQTAYSFCCWAKISTDRNTWVTALNLHGGTSGNSATFESSSDGTTWEFLTDNGGDLPLVAATVGTWHFLAARVTGTSVICYTKPLGGSIVQSATDTQEALDVDAVEFWLGEWPDGGQWLNGCLTGVKLWLGAALTQAEFDTESTQLMPVRLTNLTAAYPLEVAETTDYSGNAFTLSSSGTPTTEAGPTGIPLTSGPVTVTGTVAVNPGGVSVTATGLRIVSGVASVALPALSVAARPIVRGTASVALPALSVAAVGETVFPSPGQTYDLSQWHLTLPTEDPGDGNAAQIDQPELATYTDDHFFTDDDGMMVFVAPVNGATTSAAAGGTRSELRQHLRDGYAEAAIDPNNTGRFQLTVTTHADATNITGGTNPRKEAIIGQIHGAGDSPIPLILSAEYHVATPRVRVFKNGPSDPVKPNAVVGITPTTPITYRIRIENDRLKMWVVIGQVADLPGLDEAAHYDWPVSDFSDVEGWYYKVGIYNKTSISSGSTGESIARVSSIEVLEPGDPDPTGVVFGTAAVDLGAMNVAATGYRLMRGTVSAPLGALSVAATGTVVAEVITGTASVALPAPTVSAVGTRVVRGVSTVELGALGVIAAGAQTVTGTVAVSLGQLSVTAAGTVVAEVVTGSASVALGGAAITAVGSRVTTGTAAVALPALSVVVLGAAVHPRITAGTPVPVPGPYAGTPTPVTGPTAGTPTPVPGPTAGTPIAR